MASAQFDIFRVTARMTVGIEDSDVQNTMHFRQESVGGLSDQQVLDDLASVMDQLYTNVVADIVDEQTFVDVLVKNITQDVLLGATPFPVLTVGGTASDAVAWQTVGLLLLKTAKSRVVGRVSLGIFRDNVLVNSVWNAAIIANALLFGAALLADFIEFNSDWRYVVFNREFETLTLPVSAGFISSARTQRRRSRGIGS